MATQGQRRGAHEFNSELFYSTDSAMVLINLVRAITSIQFGQQTTEQTTATPTPNRQIDKPLGSGTVGCTTLISHNKSPENI
jgi:hypothetical protein